MVQGVVEMQDVKAVEGHGVVAASHASCQVFQPLEDFRTLSNLHFLRKFLPVHDNLYDE